MSKAANCLGGLLPAAFVVTGALAIGPVLAQDKAQGQKTDPYREPTRVLFDNDAVRVQEVTFRPGEQGQNIPRPFRVIRILQGGTMQRIHPDGRSEIVVYKTGEVIVYEAEKPFVPKNVGATDIVMYVVALKSPGQ